MRRLPVAVSAAFPDPAGLPLPCSGIRGLRVFLASPDPAAIHDAFSASALVGECGAVECWLDPGPQQHLQDPNTCGSTDAKDRAFTQSPHSAATVDDPAASAATPAATTIGWRGSVEAAVALANEQLADWAGMLSIPQPGNLVIRLRSAVHHQLEVEDYDLAAVSGLPLGCPAALASALASLHSALKMGGELFISALLCNRRLGSYVSGEVLEAAGVGPVMYFEDFVNALRAAGFCQPRVVRIEPWDLQGGDEEAQYILLNSNLSTFQIRAQKNRLLEGTCEDYGQWVVYKGTLEGSDEAYTLDLNHRLVRNQPLMVCGNTAAILGDAGISWLSRHFIISGDRSVHYGAFMGGGGVPRTTERCCLWRG
ncbi:hypothetical protein Vretimale_464 [Volvox reticuliferus]|uniref:Uncharacterized protein n=1 Tax=Volvox reticuliferus TaxID=1737510 RepID=A0A8J4D5P6_9CHLO|nr:hypothetical protein Vretifemale_2548 [Volvox reticuliferus]GIL94191.1 hypothetical protein Vretimale_464 [Volvox reticuliferus]